MSSMSPRYVKFRGTALRHTGDGRYWRDAGQWALTARIVDGRLVVAVDKDHPVYKANGTELIEITHAQWAEDNKGYP